MAPVPESFHVAKQDYHFVSFQQNFGLYYFVRAWQPLKSVPDIYILLLFSSQKLTHLLPCQVLFQNAD